MFNLKIKKIKKIKLHFITFNIECKKNNLFLCLSINNKLIYYESFGYIKKSDILMNMFNKVFFFVNKNNINKYHLLIFKISGLNIYIKKNFRKMILNFLKDIKFKKGYLFFVEKTSLSFNGSRVKKKKRKTYKKKKRNLFFLVKFFFFYKK